MPWLDSQTAEKYRSVIFDYITQHKLASPPTEVNPKCDTAPRADECRYSFIEADTISAAIKAHAENPNSHIAVLNFASFKNPGGGFMRNAIAQEESLCYCTNLYPALAVHNDDWYVPHQKHLHKGMYENQSLLSHGVTVLASEPGKLLPTEEQFTIDVLTCAAPNWSAALKYGTLTEEELKAATRDRIKYVMRVFSNYDYDNVIVGAYGCGVFKNDPTVVVQAFLKAMGMYKLKHVTFAVPDKNSYCYRAFENELEGKHMEREFSDRLTALGLSSALINSAVLSGSPIVTNNEGVQTEPSSNTELIVRQLANRGYLTYLVNVGSIGDKPATSYFVISRDREVWKDEFAQVNQNMHVALAFVNPEELFEPKFVFLHHENGKVLPMSNEQAEELIQR